MSSTTSASQAELSAQSSGPVLFFDGVCGLCNSVVDFVIRHDAAGQFRFAPLQGETARQSLPAEEIEQLGTVVLQLGSRQYRKSAAVVRILWCLGGVWKIPGTMLWLIPAPVRDLGYRIVARWRYRLFGRKETCRMPTPEERDRILP
ncbi:MAG: thiol-disulfide oxidoreductase DCC family protein [Maioricimonas sp. JB049]